MRSETKQIGSTAGGVGQGRQRSASLEQPITQVNVAPSQSILKDMKEDVENKDPQQQREDQVSGKIMTESDRDEVKEAKPHTPFGLASAVAHDRLMRRVALQVQKPSPCLKTFQGDLNANAVHRYTMDLLMCMRFSIIDSSIYKEQFAQSLKVPSSNAEVL